MVAQANNIMNLDSFLVEKYRPRTLNEIVLDDKTRKLIEKFQADSAIPNLLFVGSPGVGKTSLAQIIVRDILKCDALYINASDENGIDVIRHKVANFAQVKSFNSGVKVVILDEGDSITFSAQAALRNSMETYAKYCRFIITANYKHKIIPAVQSRCQQIVIKPNIKQCVVRCMQILKAENVHVDDSQKQLLVQLIKSGFPDMRRCINDIHMNIVDGKLAITNVSGDSQLYEVILKHVVKEDVLKLRAYLINNEHLFNCDYDALMTGFLEFIFRHKINNESTKKAIIATIATHLYQSAFVIDKEINAFACWIAIERLFTQLKA